MPTSPQLTIIIPTLTNDAGLFYLLKKLSSYRLIVVDNLPSKNKKRASLAHPDCRYLPQKKNQGFARAINLAFKHAKTDWICILNDDIEFLATPPLSKLMSLARKNRWAAISPVLTKKTHKIENIGYQVLPIGKAKLVFPDSATPSPDHTMLDGLTAACLVISSSAFRSVGGFDGRFFAYLEDIDLFLRLKRQGFHFGVASSISVIHNHMTTSSKMNNFKARMDLRNWCYLILNNWTLAQFLAHLPGIIFERIRNLSGYLKATVRSYGHRTLYLAPYELLRLCLDLIRFPFSPRSSIRD